MLKILFLILVVMSSAVFAQDVGNTKPEAEKVDEFPMLADCDRGARMDYLLVELQNQPKAKGYIFFYQGEDALPSEIENPTRAKDLYLNYAINQRGFDPSRLVLINSYRNETVTELWIVPENAKPPTPTDTIAKPKISLKKTFLYDRKYFEFDYSGSRNEFLLPEKKAELEREEKNLEEQLKADGIVTEIEETPAEEVELTRFDWISERFGEFLKKNKKMKGVIIFYADDLEYDTGKFWNLIEEGRRKMSEQSNISPEKIQILFGGYREYVQMEFYVMPENGELPIPKAEERIVEEETGDQ